MIVRSTAQDGFSLMEMVIVLVLMGVVSAALFPAITSMNRTASRTTSLSQASGELKVASRYLEQDVRAIGSRRMSLTPLGSDGFTSTTFSADLTKALGETYGTSDAALYARGHDVVVATPTRFEFLADVLPAKPGPELVKWNLLENTNRCGDRDPAARNWCVQRSVWWTNGGAGQMVDIMARGRGVFPATDTCYRGATSAKRLFCYEVSRNGAGTTAATTWNTALYTWNTGWTPTSCNQRWADLAVTEANRNAASTWISPVVHSGFTTSTRLSQLDTITGVGVVLPAGGSYGASVERVLDTAQLNLRGRQGTTYRAAIMCGAR
ncbi:MAG: hypothetical protein JWN72_2628 [Thermoleophilia bacterium]|nr:hypothetical protein [Thermoleophilia bacterium]